MTPVPSRDSRIDAYIEKSAEFAHPILNYLRDVVHEACPEVQETMKWSMAAFEHHGLLAIMAAFKQHCGFVLWKGGMVLEKGERSGDAMGQFGRITSIKDLPPKRVLLGYIREAARMNEEGVKKPARKAKPKVDRELEVPEYLIAALRRNKQARQNFEAFSYTKRKDYVEWLTEAKTEATREKRLATAVEWIAENKGRNWKYEQRN
ncbi:MAG TPA: YdeI/OmpD-associated family protein [Candidatus Acidoferrales bacterium]|nr:YdeI/OmpD-associated family protein [Candidatus Acidoferrales bacterium]